MKLQISHILIIAGLALIALAQVPGSPLATLFVDTTPPEIVGGVPWGEAPDGGTTSMLKDTDYQIYAVVDDESPISSVSIEIGTQQYAASYWASSAYGEQWGINWHSPSTNQMLVFKATATDAATNQATRTINVAIGSQDGYFKINGQSVSETSVLYINTYTITIDFYATAFGSSITDVKVLIYPHKSDDTLLQPIELHPPEVETDTKWSTTYTLPNTYTKFTVHGFFYVGSDSYEKMSIVAFYGDYAEPPVFQLRLGTLLGSVLVAVGAVMYLKARKGERS